MKSSRSRQIIYNIIFNFPFVFKISLLFVEIYRYRTVKTHFGANSFNLNRKAVRFGSKIAVRTVESQPHKCYLDRKRFRYSGVDTKYAHTGRLKPMHTGGVAFAPRKSPRARFT